MRRKEKEKKKPFNRTIPQRKLLHKQTTVFIFHMTHAINKPQLVSAHPPKN